ncbi:MAG: hypothetical protein JWO44_2795 [Bacteroidetes bacterium]|nr:hypothetical protein [Bacteroidota bacterium]
MARQKGIIKLKGTIGDISFYKSQDGHLAREKGGVDASRIANDPAFVRTRENGAEFGASAASGKLVRDAFRSLMMSAADGRVTSRLTKVMSQIKNFDGVSVRGKRVVQVGIGTPSGKAALQGFNFNKRAILGSLLFKPYAITSGTGVITINGLVPMNDIAYPAGATHVSIKNAFADVDFGGGLYDVQISNTVNLPINGTSTNVILTPPAVPSGAGIKLNLLMVEFFQEVNGHQYSLKNGAYNALCVVEVQ